MQAATKCTPIQLWWAVAMTDRQPIGETRGQTSAFFAGRPSHASGPSRLETPIEMTQKRQI